MIRRPPRSTLTYTPFPYPTLVRSGPAAHAAAQLGRSAVIVCRMHALLPAKVTDVEESRVAQRLVEIVQCHRKRCLGHGGRMGEASLGVEGERRAVDVFEDLRGVYRIAGYPERGDGKSVVEGKSVSVRVDLGGSGII